MVYVEMIITGFVDALEEFFQAISLPTSKHIKEAFKYSLAFLLISIVAKLINIWCFVSWQEALVCTVLLGLITLIDTSVRGEIASNVTKIKSLADKKRYVESDEEVEVIEDATRE